MLPNIGSFKIEQKTWKLSFDGQHRYIKMHNIVFLLIFLQLSWETELFMKNLNTIIAKLNVVQNGNIGFDPLVKIHMLFLQIQFFVSLFIFSNEFEDIQFFLFLYKGEKYK